MISIEEYNNAEAVAINQFPNLYLDNRWGATLTSQDYTAKVAELKELQIFLNRFQSNRFCSYIQELGGLSKDDLRSFNEAKQSIVAVQQCYYPETKPVVPVETLLSAFAIYRKIKTARPEAKTILEVGPGAGLNSLFFSQDSAILNYTQIEAVQATYLSQSMVNAQCYGADAYEMAFPSRKLSDNEHRCWHVPWWKVSELYAAPIQYDVITANACMNEISDKMVNRYLGLFHLRSHSNTLLLLQDLGDFIYRQDNHLKKWLNACGWFLVAETVNWSIEYALAANHGDAVTTWWLSRKAGEVIDKPKSRYLDGSVQVNLDWTDFRYGENEQPWTRERLAGVV